MIVEALCLRDESEKNSVKPLLEKNYVDLELVTFYWTTLYLSG